MSNETNAERLKDLKEYWTGMCGRRSSLGQAVQLDEELDVLWAIEQAERAQELDAWEETARNYFGENASLKEANERLRKELAELKVVKWKNGRPTVIDWNNERWIYSPETMYKGGK